jgi:hypothetical protein
MPTSAVTQTIARNPSLDPVPLNADASGNLIVSVGANTTGDTTSSGTITTQNLSPTGTATAGSAVAIVTDARQTVAFQVTGTYTGALSAQATIDGATWVTLGGITNVNTGVQSATITSGATGIYQLETGGFAQIRITGLAAVTGTATISLRASVSNALVGLDGPIPAGTAAIGSVTVTGTVAVAEQNGGDTTASGNITTQNLNPSTGTATAGSTVAIATDGRPTVSVQVTGTYTGALTPQATVDGTNWVTLNGLLNANTGAFSATIVSAAVGIYQIECAGFAQVRISALAAVTGTAVLSLRACARMGLIGLDSPLPAGSNSIGTVVLGAGSAAVGSLTVGTANIGTVGQAQGSTTSGQFGQLVQGAVTTSNPTYTTAQTSPVSLTTLGELRVQAVGITPLVTATYTRAADATQYSIGDLIANSTTAASVIPITFTPGRPNGRIIGTRCVLTAASGTVVLPAFDLLLFRVSAASVPFTAGSYPADNTALNVSSTNMIQLIGIVSFSATSWRNQAGGSTAAGLNVWQEGTLVTAGARGYAPFNLTGLGTQTILGLMQAQNTWNPGAISNQFDFVLELDQD